MAPPMSPCRSRVDASAVGRALDLAQARDAVVLGPGLGQGDGTREFVREFVRRCPVQVNGLGRAADDREHRRAP